MSFEEGSLDALMVLAARPGLVFIVIFGVGIALAIFAVFYFFFRMGK